MKIYLIECDRQFILVSLEQNKYAFATTDYLTAFRESSKKIQLIPFEYSLENGSNTSNLEKFCDPMLNSGGIIAMRDTTTDELFIYDRHRYKALA